jgi:uncharacterized protein
LAWRVDRSGGWTRAGAGRRVREVTSRPRRGQPPGVPVEGSVQPRSSGAGPSPPGSPPACETASAGDDGAIVASAAAGTDGLEERGTALSTVAAEPSAAGLAGDLPLRRHRLPVRVITYWRCRAVCSALPVLILLLSLAIVLPWGDWWLRWGIVGVAVVVVAAGTIVLPPIRYRVFWYAISQTELDVQDGVVFTTRSVVPMRRVQSLRTERGPLANHFRMTNLKIRTAAGSVRLGGLDRGEAGRLCERISRLTDLADDV